MSVHIFLLRSAYGFKIQALELMPFGFLASLEANIDDYNNKFLKSNIAEFKKIFVAIAGPFLNIIFVLFFINKDNDISKIVAYSNLLIFLLNLIPIFPLDGGNLLKSLLSIFFGRAKANVIVNKVSNAVIIFLTIVTSFAILYFKNISMLFILLYLWNLVIKENKYFHRLQGKII